MNSKMATALYKVVYVTVPSTEIGKNIAKEIIQKRLAACVNIVPQLTSIYEWKGKIEEENESLLIIKTEADRLIQLEETVNKIHPYDVPEFIVLPIEKGISVCRLTFIKLRSFLPAALLSIPLTLTLFWITGFSDYFFEINFDDFKWPPFVDVQKQVSLELLGCSTEIPPINLLTQFQFLHRPTCKNNRLTRKRSILVIVKSAPERIKNRESIRSTFGSSLENDNLTGGFRFRIIFVFGKPVDFVMDNLELENKKYEDLIIGDFIDNYFNNTLKFIYSIKFAHNYCNGGTVPFVLLLDDDYLLLPWNLAAEVEKHVAHESISEYPFNAYPPYITAGAVLISGQTINEFYIAIQHTAIFIFDDIYAGILSYLLAIQPQHNPNFSPFPHVDSTDWWKTLIAAHGYSSILLNSTYNELLKIRKEEFLKN
uniref:Hexosyltransferase n=1 Tax=Meloidogyne floridensis TaxID=298350 RepID=A0A915PCS4_9BILA